MADVDPDHPAAVRAGFAVVKDDMHPFGDANQVTVHEGSKPPPAEVPVRQPWVIAFDPRTTVSVLLVLVGAVSCSVAAFMVSVALGLAVVGVLCLGIGFALGVTPPVPGSSEEG